MKLTQVTNTWMRRRRGLLTVATIAAVLGGVAIAAADVQPLAGTYRASANGTALPNKGEGCFVEKPTVFGKRVKGATGHGTICDGNIIGSGNDRTTPRIVLDILGVDPKLDPEPLLFKSIGEGSRQINYGKVYSGLYEFEGHVVPYVFHTQRLYFY